MRLRRTTGSLLAALATLSIIVCPMAMLAANADAATHITGPPLGYYYTVLKTCQHDRRDYYHNRPFYIACHQAAEVVSGANHWCKDATLAGVVLAIIQKTTGKLNGYATLALVTGLGIACVI